VERSAIPDTIPNILPQILGFDLPSLSQLLDNRYSWQEILSLEFKIIHRHIICFFF
jgi:hypothetical protein